MFNGVDGDLNGRKAVSQDFAIGAGIYAVGSLKFARLLAFKVAKYLQQSAL
jgi:hypothetical protein